MEPHVFLDEDLRGDAALFVLEALEPAQARAYRLHLARCEACRVEVESLAASARELHALAASEPVPRGLWERVVERIRSGGGPPDGAGGSRSARDPRPGATQIWKHWDSDASGIRQDFTFLAADDSGFEPTAVPGIEARKLFVDRAQDRVTMIVRMQPGTAYPPHIHGDVEECFVLSGDLRVGDSQELRAGDYQRAEKGSRHAVQSTRHGCVLLLVSSLSDELV